MKVIKNFDNGQISVVVKKLDQSIEIISERPLNPDEDFSNFHPNTTPLENTAYNYTQNQQNTPFIGTYNKNIGGIGITVTRKLK